MITILQQLEQTYENRWKHLPSAPRYQRALRFMQKTGITATTMQSWVDTNESSPSNVAYCLSLLRCAKVPNVPRTPPLPPKKLSKAILSVDTQPLPYNLRVTLDFLACFGCRINEALRSTIVRNILIIPVSKGGLPVEWDLADLPEHHRLAAKSMCDISYTATKYYADFRQARKVGLLPDEGTAHDFRRAFITKIALGSGLVIAAKAVGHRSTDTTMRYVQPSSSQLAKEVFV